MYECLLIMHALMFKYFDLRLNYIWYKNNGKDGYFPSGKMIFPDLDLWRVMLLNLGKPESRSPKVDKLF